MGSGLVNQTPSDVSAWSASDRIKVRECIFGGANPSVERYRQSKSLNKRSNGKNVVVL